MSPSTTLTFFWYDYFIFVLVLVFSLSIGVYFGYFAKKKQINLLQYLHGGKTMTPVQIALSQVASCNCTPVILGYCFEVYGYGASIWIYSLSYFLMYLLSKYIYLPVFFNLQITSIYEYLEMRFDRRSRLFCSAAYIFTGIAFTSVTIYTPAMALSAVTGVKLQYLVVVVSIICIFYTTVGGFKTVVWTDVLQFLVVTGSLIIILIVGTISVKGPAEVWKQSRVSGRISLDFDLDPTKHDTFWIITFGASILSLLINIDQVYVQKFFALPNFKKSLLAVLYFAIGQLLFITLCTLVALVMYAKYSKCDPMSAGFIEKPDQLLPYFTMDVGKMIPGLPGIFIASMFSSSLSFQSAMLNGLPAIMYLDFISHRFKTISEKKVTKFLKLLTLSMGVLCTLLTFLVQHLGTLFQFMYALMGVTFGPILGLFTCGLLIPRANAKGAFYGTLIGTFTTLAVTIPSTYYKSQNLIFDPTKPFSNSGCPQNNQTIFVLETPRNFTSSFTPHVIFRISFYYYLLISVCVTIIAIFVISYLSKTNESPVDKKLLSPLIWPLLQKQDNTLVRQENYKSVDDALKCLDTE